MSEDFNEKNYPRESEQHRQLRDGIWAQLKEWRRFIVAVDGVDAAGKTTLARYLGWQLGMPTVETDLYIVEDTLQRTGTVAYRNEELLHVLQQRLKANRPLIVEGIRVLHTLQNLQLKPDYLVWVEQEGWSGGDALSELLAEYAKMFQPLLKADFTFKRPPDDASI